MLPRRLRLTRRAFVPALRARRATTEHFSASLSPSLSEGGCAAIVSKKTARRSVDRHLLKRRILSVMRPWCAPSHSLIVYARAGSPSLPFKNLKDELEGLLARLIPIGRAY